MQSKESNPLIERYQALYVADPKSRIFAPLAEAYRRQGHLDKALQLAEKGVKEHPQFASGRVALGKIYFDKKNFEKASEQFKLAADTSPENILAHQLLGECALQLGNHKMAMDSFKMVLFLNPNDLKIAKIVRDLEQELMQSAFAEDSSEDDEEYLMKPLTSKTLKGQNRAVPTSSRFSAAQPPPQLEKALALFDAWFNRGDWTKSREILDSLGPSQKNHTEVQSRYKKLESLTKTSFDDLEIQPEWISPLAHDHKEKKIQALKALAEKIETRKKP